MVALSHKNGLRHRVYEIIELGPRGDILAKIFDVALLLILVANVTAAVLSTVPEISGVYGRWLLGFDIACGVFFVVEYVARIWTAPDHPAYTDEPSRSGRVRYALTPMMIIDFISLVPILLDILFGPGFAISRVLRMIRFFRLARYSPALVSIGRVLALEWRPLFGSAVLFGGLLMLASALMYAAEGHLQPENFGSIPRAMWWGIVTISTVGYGDVVPVSVVGKIIAGLTMVTGILFFALPIGIIATGFHQEIRRSQFVVSFGLVARVPVFAHLDAKTIANLVSILHAKRYAEGATIMQKGDRADGMYFIASGLVRVELAGRPIELKEGDFFGEIALLRKQQRRTATIIAARNCELLKLEAEEFHRLIQANPALAAAVEAVARKRQTERGDAYPKSEPVAKRPRKHIERA